MRSLRWRLLAGAAVAIFAALLIAWLLMMLLFERHLERRLAAELESDGIRIVAGLTVSPEGRPAVDDPPTDARFQTPASGLYWQVSYRRLLVRSPSLWDQALPPPAAASAGAWRPRLAAGPFQQRLVFIERNVIPTSGGDPVLVQVAQDAAALDLAGAEFGRELASFLALLWLALAIAAWVQVSLGLRPLKRMSSEVERLEQDPGARLDEAGATEVRPLIHAINALADARARDLTRARRRATDLAHGLKTPLSALSAQVRRAREQGAADAADGLDRALVAMQSVVQAELARARMAAVRIRPGVASDLRKVAERLLAVLERTEAGEELVFENAVPSGMRARLAEEDLAELLGAIADNAVRYARRTVRVDGAVVDGETVISIEDDGPGLERQDAERALMRGARVDESGSGQGLGLAIAREIMEATEGRIALTPSPLGGLRVELRWPRG